MCRHQYAHFPKGGNELLKMKGLPRDRGGAVILEGLSQSKQKEKEVKQAVRKLIAEGEG